MYKPTMHVVTLTTIILTGVVTVRYLAAQETTAASLTASAADGSAIKTSPDPANYTLGPGDEIGVWSYEMEELNNKTARVDATGYIELPLAGRIQAQGLTTNELAKRVNGVLMKYATEPHITMTIASFASQPVSIMGAVNLPGVYHLKRRTTLADALAMAGGPRPDAGSTVKITRRKDMGPIPLSSAAESISAEVSVGEVNLNALLTSLHPEENIPVCANDIILVPKAEMIYVVGEVHRSGGFPLDQRGSLSVLQAISMAGGLNTVASPKYSRLIRKMSGAGPASTKVIDLRKLFEGATADIPLQPDDILFIPSSGTKKASVRAIEAAIQTITGVVIWHGL